MHSGTRLSKLSFSGDNFEFARYSFMYLVAIIDWHSRKVLSWRLSNSLDSAPCIEAIDEALASYGPPEVFNSDQGCQFTSESFTDVLKDHDVQVSMDGKGRGWIMYLSSASGAV